jgi:hypothetical protein
LVQSAGAMQAEAIASGDDTSRPCLAFSPCQICSRRSD